LPVVQLEDLTVNTGLTWFISYQGTESHSSHNMRNTFLLNHGECMSAHCLLELWNLHICTVFTQHPGKCSCVMYVPVFSSKKF